MMKRRSFLTYSGFAVGVPSFLTSCQQQVANNKQDSLRSFIVSDAHIGWRGKHQPTPELQGKLVDNILKKFSNLDLAFDTGDVHHGYLNEKERYEARTDWLNNIANKFSTTPFHYTPGNHELGKAFMDPEVIASQFGSIAYRPYYAFDYMGIHFISLPQLQSTILISKETINWLKLDLALNKDKTTVILSHNSIKGTTFNNQETGYRCLTNSDELRHILKENPQIKAWFHGHNHHYEIVEQEKMLHVSNGRIGGFNPPESWGSFGQGHLGGVFFEIDNKGIIVKAYSASKKVFLDEAGFPGLSARLNTKTTFDASQPFNFYCGNGNTLNKTPQQIQNHYISREIPKLYISPVEKTINDNHTFSYPTEYFFSNKPQNKIIGYKINSNKIIFNNHLNGLKISNPEEVKSFKLAFPTHKRKKNKHYKRGSYFRTRWGQKYILKTKIQDFDAQRSDLSLKVNVYSENYKLLNSYSHKPHSGKNKEMAFNFSLDAKKENTDRLYVFFELLFNDCYQDIIIEHVKLIPVLEQVDNLTNGSFILNNLKQPIKNIASTQAIALENQFIAGTNIAKIEHTNHSTCSLLIKQTNIEWQLRNATGFYKNEDTLYIKPHDTKYNQRVETVLSPTVPKTFYMNKCLIENPIEVSHIADNQIIIDTIKSSISPTFYIVSDKQPSSVSGATLLNKSENFYVYVANKTQISITR